MPRFQTGIEMPVLHRMADQLHQFARNLNRSDNRPFEIAFRSPDVQHLTDGYVSVLRVMMLLQDNSAYSFRVRVETEGRMLLQDNSAYSFCVRVETEGRLEDVYYRLDDVFMRAFEEIKRSIVNKLSELAATWPVRRDRRGDVERFAATPQVELRDYSSGAALTEDGLAYRYIDVMREA